MKQIRPRIRRSVRHAVRKLVAMKTMQRLRSFHGAWFRYCLVRSATVEVVDVVDSSCRAFSAPPHASYTVPVIIRVFTDARSFFVVKYSAYSAITTFVFILSSSRCFQPHLWTKNYSQPKRTSFCCF